MSRLILLWVLWAGSGISEGLECCIFWRAIRGSTVTRYPYFYAYIATTLTSFVLLIVYLVDRESYNHWYWPIQFVTLVFGCGVIVEIFQHVLSPYPGAKRFAKLTAFAAFGGLFCLAIVYALFHLEPSTAAAGIELERNVRALQAIFLFAVLAIIFHYAIPVGRNIRGMILGYGIYIGTSLISRAVEAYAAHWLRLVWLYVQPLSFEASLTIWLVTLWSYHPNPVPGSAVRIEADYELLASHTRKALNATRSYLGGTARF
ncbi:MAG: hypothetical protein ACRD4X_02395 [Candidatus Acidiferrales bacterium]